MGQDSSKSEELQKKEIALERKRILLEQREEQLRDALILEKHFHEQKLQEEARLKKVKAEWQREQYLNEQKQQCQQQNQQLPQQIHQSSVQNQQWTQQNPQWQQNVQQQQQQHQDIEKQQFEKKQASIPQSNDPAVSLQTQIRTAPIISPVIKPQQIEASAPSEVPSESKLPQMKASAPPKVPSYLKPHQIEASASSKVSSHLKPTQIEASATATISSEPKLPQIKASAPSKMHSDLKPHQIEASAPSKVPSESKLPQMKASAPSKVPSEAKRPLTWDLRLKASSAPKIYPDLKSLQIEASTSPKICPELKPLQTKASDFNQTKELATKKASLDVIPKSNNVPEIYEARLAALNVRYIEWTEIDYIHESNHISHIVAENIVKLLNDDNTIAFIARYRKNMTQGMNTDELQRVKNSLDTVKLIKQKANSIIKDIEKQGKWTAALHVFVQGIRLLNDLEQIHSMFKAIKGTLVDKARDLGLGVPAQAIIKGEKIDPLFLYYLVETRIEGLRNEEQISDGIVCILADIINKDERTFEIIRKLRRENPIHIHTTKIKSKNKEGKESKSGKKMGEDSEYDHYQNFSAPESNLKSHAILAINRGEAKKILTVEVVIPTRFEQDFKEQCTSQYRYALNASPLHKTFLIATFDYVWNKSIKPSIETKVKQELNERAEMAFMDAYADNVKQILLTAPIRGKVVLGVVPGFHDDCKMAVVSEQGELLETKTIYPHDSNDTDVLEEAECAVARMVVEHNCTILALGNGTACRKTEVFLSKLIKKRAFGSLSVVYTIVDEIGASIYSRRPEAKKEFPGLDANVISAISIARRLQDPIAELVKVEPKYLGAEMYQDGLPEEKLVKKLNEITMEAVSFVGVDINTASLSLLKRVAGLDESKAKSIIDYRKSLGPFRTRNDLMKVRGIDCKTFEQCAGFIRIMPETADSSDHRNTQESLNYLDQTWIHPESYDIAEAFVTAAKCNPDQLGTNAFIFAVAIYASQGYEALAKKFKTSVETIEIIVKALSMEKGQDIRRKGDSSMFREVLHSFHDWKIGTILTGVVRKRKHFGVLVDVGIENDGLLCNSCMGGMTVKIGQRVQVEVTSRDKVLLRLGLTLINCL